MRFILFTIVILINSFVFAQKPVWVDVYYSSSDTGKVVCNQLIKSNDGGYVITGFFDHKLTLPDTIIWSKGGQDGFIAKLDQTWKLEWIHTIAGPGNDAGLTITELKSYFIIGSVFSDSIKMNDSTLISKGGLDILLISFDSSGQIIWCKTAGGAGNDFIGIGRLGITYGGMSIDEENNFYIAGSFGENNQSPPLQLSAFFDSTEVIGIRGADIFLAKYNLSGKLLWVYATGGAYHDRISSVDIKNGRLSLVGTFQGTSIIFDNFTLFTKESSFNDMFIAVFDTSGTFQWARGAGNYNPVSGTSCSIDKDKSIFVTGSFHDDDLDFGNYSLPNLGGFDMFLAKYDSTGNLLWVNGGISSGTDQGDLLGEFNNDIYLVGRFSYDAIIGIDTFIDNSFTDLYIIKLDTSGNYHWALTAKGAATDYPIELHIVDEDEIYVSGYFDSPTLTFGNHTLQNAGTRNFFIARLGPDTATAVNNLEVPIVKVYPNPIQGTFFNIKFPANTFDQFAILDLQGKQLAEGTIDKNTQQLRIDAKDWPKGIYFIKLKGEKGIITESLIKNQ